MNRDFPALLFRNVELVSALLEHAADGREHRPDHRRFQFRKISLKDIIGGLAARFLVGATVTPFPDAVELFALPR